MSQKREKGAERVFEEIMAEYIPRLIKNIKFHKTSSMNSPRHIIIKLSKAKGKERTMKPQERSDKHIGNSSIILTANSHQKQWNDIFKIHGKKTLPTKNSISNILFFNKEK